MLFLPCPPPAPLCQHWRRPRQHSRRQSGVFMLLAKRSLHGVLFFIFSSLLFAAPPSPLCPPSVSIEGGRASTQDNKMVSSCCLPDTPFLAYHLLCFFSALFRGVWEWEILHRILERHVGNCACHDMHVWKRVDFLVRPWSNKKMHVAIITYQSCVTSTARKLFQWANQK